jgi:RNA polymerase sigma-70 factor (ECF subfamily)
MFTTSTTLVEGLSRLDKFLWARFVSLYEPLLLNYVRKNGVAESDVRDVVHDIWIKLWVGLPKFHLDHSKGRFRTWLFNVACNAARDYHRKKNAQHQQPFGDDVPDPVTPSPAAEKEWADDVRRMAKERATESVRAETEARTWACYVEHRLNGRPSREVGASLGLSENAVNVYSSRIFKRVRELSHKIFNEELVT